MASQQLLLAYSARGLMTVIGRFGKFNLILTECQVILRRDVHTNVHFQSTIIILTKYIGLLIYNA